MADRMKGRLTGAWSAESEGHQSCRIQTRDVHGFPEWTRGRRSGGLLIIAPSDLLANAAEVVNEFECEGARGMMWVEISASPTQFHGLATREHDMGGRKSQF